MTCCYDSVKAGHCHSKGRGQCKHFICFRTAHCAMIGTLIREPKPQGFVVEFIPVSKRSWKKPACPWCHKHDGENKREKRHYEEGSWQALLPTSALRFRLSKEVNGLRFTHTMNVAAHTKLIGVKWVSLCRYSPKQFIKLQLLSQAVKRVNSTYPNKLFWQTMPTASWAVLVKVYKAAWGKWLLLSIYHLRDHL